MTQEELVEEIAKESPLDEQIAIALSKHRRGQEGLVELTSGDWELGQWLISRILKAVEDGTLPLSKVPPKLPGEVGRINGDTMWVRYPDYDKPLGTPHKKQVCIKASIELLDNKDEPIPDTVFIALRRRNE